MASPLTPTPTSDSLNDLEYQKFRADAAGGFSVAVVNPDGSSVANTVDTSGTATTTNVSSSASSVTLLASNSSRKMATIYNDSTQVLYLLLGSTAASNTNYTVQLTSGAYYELPITYTGQINGIWASANGAARITELS